MLKGVWVFTHGITKHKTEVNRDLESSTEGMVGTKKTHKQVEAFLSYVLGRRPEEFGLIPDEEGFVSTKEFLKAVSEEDGWRNVNTGMLNELKMSMADPFLEIKGGLIRAVKRENLPERVPALDPPKVLFTGITGKSHQVVLEKGILPTRHKYVILAEDEHMAVRIAKRRDPSPVILAVNTAMAMDKGAMFYQKGEGIYLARYVDPGCFTGPPLPKEKKPSDRSKKRVEQIQENTAGSFVVDVQNLERHKGWGKNKRGQSWKRDKKKIRRERKKEWPE